MLNQKQNKHKKKNKIIKSNLFLIQNLKNKQDNL